MLEGCVPWPDEFVKMYKEKGYWEDITLGEHLDRWVEQYADRPAIAFQGQEITYREMGENATRLAYQMAKMGIKTYDRVIFQLFNGPDLLYLIYACFKIGAIPICSLPTHRWAEVSYLAETAEARVHVIPAGTVMGFDYEEFADQIREAVPSMQFVLALGQPRRPDMVSINDFMDSDIDIHTAREELAKYRPDPMEPALFQLSGGTTGVPKIIPRTHNDYYYNIRCMADANEHNEQTRFVAPLPMTHNAPLACMILPTHLKGGCIIPAPPKLEAILQVTIENKANVLVAGAFVAQGLVDITEEKKNCDDLSSVKRLWCAQIMPEAHQTLRERFSAESVQIFGMAEGLICSTRLSDSLDITLYSQGKPVSEADEMKIVDPATGEELPAGQTGEMLCRGPYTLRGYYKSPERNQEAFTPDGYYRSGDLVKIDTQGNMTWSGRIKDCIDRGGEKINAEEVEDHIAEFPRVKQVAVVAMPDRTMGERICAFVVPMPGETFALDELCEFLLNERKIAKFKLPERLEFIDELPVTKVGKLEKKSLREKIAAVLIAEGKYEAEKEESQKPLKTVKEALVRMTQVFDPNAAEGVTEVFQLHITGEQAGAWHLAVKEGSCNLTEGVHENPTLTLTMADSDFVDLRNGETDGQTLMVNGQLKVEGDFMAATLIPSLFPIT